MLSTVTRRTLVGATVVVIAATGAGSALAAPAAQKTTLTISSRTTGMSTVAQPIAGTLKAGGKTVAGQVVRLVGRLAGSTSFKTLRYGKTDANGVVTFSVKPPKGKDVYELVYNGSHKTSPSYDGSHSKTVTVTVSK